MKPIELLIVASDIHCGSDVGLAPPETKTSKGNIISFGDNIHQEWLWAMWVEGCARVKQIIGKSSAALLVNGDATEGVHHRNDSALLMSSIEAHTKMAHVCLSPLAKLCQKKFVTLGTECHTLEMEHLLAEKLGAETGRAKDKWHFSIKGCEIDAAHHMSVTGRAYLEASAMSILMGNARNNYVRSGHSVPKVFLRGHRHCGGFFNDGAGIWGVTGGWQFLTRHGHKVVTDSIPRPTIMVLDWRDVKHGGLPFIHQIVFDPPPHEITEI